MSRTSLLPFFDEFFRETHLGFAYDDGYRHRVRSYAQVHAAAEALACTLRDAGIGAGERVAIWGANRPEWVVAFWACLLRGIAAVPIEPQATGALARRILDASAVRGVFAGDEAFASQLERTLPIWRLDRIEWPAGGNTAVPSARVEVGPDTVAEIVFTSGTTGVPKGVLITHRNILANIEPIESEVDKYRRYLWPLRPLWFLNLLPLSHMFGQALAMFLPPLIPAGVVFMRGHNPDEVLEAIRERRVALVTSVPRLLELLRARIAQRFPDAPATTPVRGNWLRRWWRFRHVHRWLGWRFCGFVVGGAQLDASLEGSWRALGFAVIQGYGLTETAPIVTWNHPFRLEPGTVGTPLPGVEVRLAADGEVLVRGPNVTAGYLNAPEETRAALEDGWLHTGDLGTVDQSGHLVIRGRKKEVIVTAEGLNVFPDDVERELDAIAGVRESAVVGRLEGGGDRVHAVLVLEPGTDGASVVRAANRRLESHQRISGFSSWTHDGLPRTEATGKIKRREVRRWVEAGGRGPAPDLVAPDDTLKLLERYLGGQPAGPQTRLDELGLTSLDRVELLAALEEKTHATISETSLDEAQTIEDLRRLLQRGGEPAPDARPIVFPSWNRWRLAAVLRNLSQQTWILPLSRVFLSLRVEGLERLSTLRGPVVFAANHQSHLDTPAVLAALPAPWRRTIAVPMWKEYFDPHFLPERFPLRRRLANSAIYFLTALFFNGFPLPQQGPGTRQTLRYIGGLVSDGCSLLIFPEGERTRRGEIGTFAAGVGLIASRLQVPVVPVRLEGVHRVLHRDWRWPRRGTVHVIFGAPLALEGADYAGLARQVEDAVRALGPRRPGALLQTPTAA